MKTDFEPYPIGTVHNVIDMSKEMKPIHREVEIEFPSRLNAMAIDPSKITSNKNMVYTPGEVVFSIQIFNKIKVKSTNRQTLEISKRSKRSVLVKHAAIIMQKLFKDETGLFIDVDNSQEIRHAGLGSSSALIAGVAAAINELYGNPIATRELAKYVAQNHGEEIDGDNEQLNPVQCIGGSAISGLNEGGVFVIAGETEIISSMHLDSSKEIILGIPNDFLETDSKSQFEDEKDNLDKFLKTGKKYGQEIAYRMLHQAIPGIINNDVKPLGDLIFDYRFHMGSIENCSYVYPKMTDIAKELAFLKELKHADVLAISSVGPTFFATGKDTELIEESFAKNNLKVIKTKICNSKYTVKYKN